MSLQLWRRSATVNRRHVLLAASPGQIAPGAAARARAARSLGRASAASGRDLPGRFSTSCVIASGKVPSRSPASPPHHPSSSRTDLSGSLAARPPAAASVPGPTAAGARAPTPPRVLPTSRLAELSRGLAIYTPR